MDMKGSKKNVVILAAGDFPTHPVPLRALREADFVVCCDSAYGQWKVESECIHCVDLFKMHRRRRYLNFQLSTFNFQLSTVKLQILIYRAVGCREPVMSVDL